MLNKTYGGIKLWWILIPTGIAIIGLVVGSFVDFQLSSAIANPNTLFACISESCGELPGYLTGPVGSALLFLGLKDSKKKFFKIAGWAFPFLGVGICTYYYGKSLARSRESYGLGCPTVLAYLIAFTLIVATLFLTIHLFKSSDKTMLVKVGGAIAICLVGELILQTVIKYFAGRPRYRTILADGVAFRNWWEWDWFSTYGLPNGEYRSFLSGHSSTSMVLSTLASLSLLKPHKKLLAPIMYTVGASYGILTAAGRVIAGAHFLSDVSAGLLLTIILMFISFPLIFKDSSRLSSRP